MIMEEEEEEKQTFTFHGFKNEETLLRYKECSSALESLYKGDFYACVAEGKSSYYLCAYCAKNCHKGHEDRKVSKGNFKCSCAENGHVCPRIVREYSGAEKCVYKNFFDKTPNCGYYYFKDNNNQIKTYCAVCYNICKKQKSQPSEVKENQKVTGNRETEDKCNCSNHDISNAFLLYGDLVAHRQFTNYLRNFNANIFFRCDSTKTIIIDYLINQIKFWTEPTIGNDGIHHLREEKLRHNRNDMKSHASKKDPFLLDSNIEAILNLFYIATFSWKNKFFFIQHDVFLEYFPKMFNILEYSIGANTYKECKLKLYLINILFSILFRGQYIVKNNLWNLNTIMNMNINQRMRYILEPEKPKLKKKVLEDQKKLINNMLIIYENLLRDFNSDSSNQENIRVEVFPLLNKLMKFVIKYNLVDAYLVERYFTVVEDTIKLFNQNKAKTQIKEEEPMLKRKVSASLTGLINEDEIKHSFNLLSLTENEHHHRFMEDEEVKENEDGFVYTKYSYPLIMKSMFYYLLYSNDKMVKTAFEEGKIKNNKIDKYKFIFNTPSRTLDTIKFIFFQILNEPETRDKHFLKYEGRYFFNYADYIFQLMCEKQENFYLNSLKNLTLLPPMFNGVEKDHKEITQFVSKIREQSRNYFTYTKNVECNTQSQALIKALMPETDNLIKDFKTAVEKQIKLPDLSVAYSSFFLKKKSIFKPESSEDILKEFQHAVKKTQLFEALEEIIHIFGFAGDFYYLNEGENTLIYPSIEHRRFLLQLYYIIIQNDFENFALFMNIKPKAFILFFSVVEDDLLHFYCRILEIMFSSDYYYGNFFFIRETLTKLAEQHSHYKRTSPKKYLKLMSCLLKILTIIMNKYKVNYQLEMVPLYYKVLSMVIKDNDIQNYIEEYFTIFKCERGGDEFIELLANYLEFLGALRENDASRYVYALLTNDMIPFNKIKDILIKSLNDDITKINIKILYPLIRYYVQRLLPFKTNVLHLYDYTINMLNDIDREDGEATMYLNNHYITFINLLLRKKTELEPISYNEINDTVTDQIATIFDLFDVMNKLLLKFEDILKYYCGAINHFESFMSLKIVMYRFYENVFMKPCYFLIKNLELFLEYIEGDKFEMLMEVIFNFLKMTQLFYLNIETIETHDERQGKDKYKSLMKEFYIYERVKIKLSLTKEEIEEIKDCLVQLNKLRFYQVKEVFHYFDKCVVKIFEYKSQLIEESKPTDIDKSVSDVFNAYEKALEGKSEFINLQKDYFDIRMVVSSYFSLFMRGSDSLIDNFQINKIKGVNFFISLMECISDFNYINKNENNNEVIDTLKKVASPEITNFYLMLITLSNVNEIVRMFELHTADEFEKPSLHCYINSTLTKFFQILCEGNQIELKRYLFNFYLELTDPGEELKKKITKPNQGFRGQRQPTFERSDTINLEFENLQHSSNVRDTLRGSTVKMVPLRTGYHHQNTRNNELMRSKDWSKENQLLSFFNIISTNMRLLVLPLQKNEKFCLTQEISTLTQNERFGGINKMFEGYKNLVIEMIQGYIFKNDNIFSYDETKPRAASGFFFLCCELGKFTRDERSIYQHSVGKVHLNYIFDPITEEIKLNFLEIIDNILKQKFLKCRYNFNFVFKFLVERKRYFYIGEYIKYIYIKHVENIPFEDTKNFEEKFMNINFTEIEFKQLIYLYKKDKEIYKDNYLKMACLLHYILKSMSDTLHITQAMKYFEMSQKTFDEFISGQKRTLPGEQKQEEQVVQVETPVKDERQNERVDDDSIEKTLNEPGHIRMKERIEKDIRSQILASKFLNRILKCVAISERTDPRDMLSPLEVKNVYFQLTPATYLIDNKSVDNFLKTACRDSRSSKLKSILEVLPDFRHEINYKSEKTHDRKYDFLYDFDYNNIDMLNCICCTILNLVYLFTLSKNASSISFLNKFSSYTEAALITVNIFFIGLFVYTKYPLHVSLLNLKYLRKRENASDEVKTKKGIWDYFQIYFLDSFLLNEEIRLMITVTLIGLIGVISKYDIILFSVQLLTIGKFVSTIQEILFAFFSKMSLILSMIAFLAILMFFFANVDIYFIQSEYLLPQEDGTYMDTCKNLLECFITLFNNGARAGGGIGDILPQQEYPSAMYYIRWIHDMVFFIMIILLLLNMINGVMVTTFGQIREDSCNRDDDMNNICFICSIPRYEIEKQGISFEHHIKKEHSVKTYVRYLLSLYLMDSNDMDQDQYYVYNCLEKNGVEFFPNCESD